jgi:hypothetical protein
MSMTSDVCLPVEFLCEHTAAKSRVFVRLIRAEMPAALKAVLTCDKPELAERAAEVLNLVGEHPLCRVLAAGIEAELPAAPAASFREALDRAEARTWPSSDMGPVGKPGRDRTDRAPHEPELPPFGQLFPVEDHDCGEDCPQTHLTPRTADLLFAALTVLADEAYDDVAEFSDEPVGSGDGIQWSVFSMLPRDTWRASAQWRRQFARACDDLAGDLAAGSLPSPRSQAEHMAIHLAIEEAPDYLPGRDGTVDPAHEALPAARWDYDWHGCTELFCAGRRIVIVVIAADHAGDGDGDADGVIGRGEDAGREDEHHDTAADDAWFDWFDGAEPRDPDRGFRR